MNTKNNMYDFLVIGAGAGGLNIYSFLHQIGMKALLIEKNEKNIGGDCLQSGCIPSKSLIHLAKIGFKGNIRDAIQEKQSHIQSHENLEYFRNKGWDICIGEAKFVGRNTVEVTDGESQGHYSGKKIIVATGSKPRMVSLLGDIGFPVYTNETIFELEQAPKNLVVLGGGPIGIEIAQAYSKLGSQVSIVTTDKRLLPRERVEVSEYLESMFTQAGIVIHKESSIKEAQSNSVLLTTGQILDCDALLVAIGRVVDIRPMSPLKADIAVDEQGRPRVDNYLRSTNSQVYFSGDAVGSYQFTHVTERHASVILNNLFTPFKKQVNYDDIGWVTFTDPEIASCGVTYEEIKNSNGKYKEYHLPFTDDDRAITDEYTDCKMWLYTEGDYIVGATIIMPSAGEVLQSILYAIKNTIRIDTLFNTIHPYPTKSRVLKSIFALHQKEKFTEKNKSLLRLLFKVFNH